MNSELKEKLASCELLVMDIDGTLTDNSMYYSSDGEYLKRFNVKDGMGITLLRKAGIKTAFLTSENSKIVETRSKKLNIDKTILGSRNKTDDIKSICDELNVDLSKTAFIGDDVNDFHALQLVGISACPSDAVESIKNVSMIHLNNKGGGGAVRELSEMILKASNKPVILQENW